MHFGQTIPTHELRGPWQVMTEPCEVCQEEQRHEIWRAARAREVAASIAYNQKMRAEAAHRQAVADAAAAGPSTAVAGPSTPVAGSSTPAAGPSTPAAGSSSPAAGPSTPARSDWTASPLDPDVMNNLDLDDDDDDDDHDELPDYDSYHTESEVNFPLNSPRISPRAPPGTPIMIHEDVSPRNVQISARAASDSDSDGSRVSSVRFVLPDPLANDENVFGGRLDSPPPFRWDPSRIRPFRRLSFSSSDDVASSDSDMHDVGGDDDDDVDMDSPSSDDSYDAQNANSFAGQYVAALIRRENRAHHDDETMQDADL